MDGVIDAKRYYFKNNYTFIKQVKDYCVILESKVNVDNLKDEIVDWIRIDDLENDPVGIEKVRTLPACKMDGMFFEVELGDILVARLGPTILNQKIVVVHNVSRRTLASSEFLVLRCKDKDMADEVMCVVRTEYYKRLMYSYSRGSTPSRYRLNREDMLNLPFPLLNKNTHKNAINMLRALQCRATKFKEADDLLTKIDTILLNHLEIGDIITQPRIAVGVKLGKLKIENTLGAEYYHPERLAVIHALENDISISTHRLADIVDFLRGTIKPINNNKPYLGLAGVVSNTGELSGINEEADGQAFIYSKGDVLYARLRPYLNKVLYAETNGICSTEFHVMRVKCNNVLPEYLAVIMRSKIIVTQTKHMMTGNTHPRISNEDVKNLRLPIPSLDIQYAIVADIRKSIKQVRQLKQEAELEWSEAKDKFEKQLMGE